MTLLAALLLAASPPLLVAEQAEDADVARVVAYTGAHPSVLARVSSAHGFVPRGAVSPDGKRAALVTIANARDRLAGGELVVVDLASGDARVVAHGVSPFDRPRFTPDGRVLFLKIVRSEEPPPLLMKQGFYALTTTELWAADGDRLDRLATFEGYGANLAGVNSRHILMYLVNAEGASIWRVPSTGGEPSRVAELPHGPFARDFALAGDALEYATQVSRGTFAVERLDLGTGGVREVLRDASDHLSPLGDAVTRERLETRDGRLLLDARGFALAESRSGARAVRVERRDREELGILDGAWQTLPTDGHFEVLGFAERR